MTMNKNDIVLIDFVAKTLQGEIFDLTREDVAKKENIYSKDVKYDPIAVVLGAGTTLPGLEDGLMQMNAGEQKEVTITPEKGFGKRDPKLIKIVPEKIFQGKIKPAPGLIVDFSGRKGRIQSCLGGRVRIDFNHPLAGKTLIYDVKIVKHVVDDKEKVEAVFSLFNIKPEITMKDKKAEIKLKGKLYPPLKEKMIEMIKQYANVDVEFIEPITEKTENKN